MFEFVRKHTKLVMGFLLLLVIPSFVFFGIENYARMNEGGNETVVKVDGQSISRTEWDRSHQANVERVRRQQPGLDAAALDSPEARRESLELLIRQRVLQAAARDLHLMPGDERLQRLFVSDPQFAGLRNPDGSVNRELLAAQGLDSQTFAAQLRTDLAMQQVLSGISGTAIATKAVVAAAADPLFQRREVQVQRFDTAALRAQINPGEADLEAYYQANTAAFRSPEQATIEYVTLDLATLSQGLAVSDEDLRRYYQENLSRFTQAEERRAAHILVKAEKDAPAADRQKAKARADELLAQVRKTPGAFAELARKNSEDPGSAERGGDLDFFGRGAMVKPFEDAVYSMKPGEISNVVESDFGYHIIQLTATRGGQSRPFEEVRAEIEAEVRRTLAQKRYAEAAEQFTNLVYEQADSLQPAIDKLKLAKRSATVLREPAPGSTGPLVSKKLLAAIFSNDSIANKRNTDAIEVAPNTLIAARIVEHFPTRTLPLAEVKDAVRERVVLQQAAALAREQGAKRLGELKTAGAAPLPEAMVISRQRTLGLPRAVVDAAMRADPEKLPFDAGVDLGNQGYAVLRVVKVLPREPVPGGDEALVGQYQQIWSGAEAALYEAALRKRYKVELKPAASAASAAASAAGR